MSNYLTVYKQHVCILLFFVCFLFLFCYNSGPDTNNLKREDWFQKIQSMVTWLHGYMVT